ncbi:MAG TPA: hypothetical protein VGP80_12060 [Gemmatimonadales bacterium]|jgi:hypothetical protein|nr:hypothetical protein [Gemmatimonadales bacterium]
MAMYRIKLASGQERTYQSIDELTSAVQGGEVNAEALIYHQRADRWLSVANHPHYQIATSRAQAQKHQPSAEASRRQVVNAVRSSNSSIKVDPNMPGTVPRSQLLEVVAEIEKRHDTPARPVKRVSIPSIKRPEEKPSIMAYENVLEGVDIPEPPKSKTTVMPLRNPPVRPAPTPVKEKVLDLADSFDLLEPGDEAPPKPELKAKAKAQVATPDVDKLLSLLEPDAVVEPLKATRPPKPQPMPESGLKSIEFIDLAADHVKEMSVLAPEPHPAPAPAPVPHHQPLVARKQPSKMPMMMAVAAVLVLGAGLVFWHPWSTAAENPTQSLGAAPAPRTDAFGGTSSVDTVAQPAPTGQATRDSAASSARDSAPAIVRVAAPRMSMKAPMPTDLSAMSLQPVANQIPAATLIQHYTTAYSDARGEMEIRMLQIGFTQLFLKSRMASASGVQDTRRLIAGAGSALRQYRAEEQRIERAYQDTVGATGRNLGWTPRDLGAWNIRPSNKETAENARLTNLMLSQVDAVFALLQEQDGKYTLSGETIVFENPDAARQYGNLRAWINQQADNYAGTGDAALPATLRQIIKGIGTTRLPQERTK